MSTTLETLEITDIRFDEDKTMSLFLSNGRVILVPLEQFKDILALKDAQRKDYEIIDGENLSFLAIDEIYSIHDLAGL